MWQDGEVDRATIEEYVELEKKIAGAETHSPALILQQKKDQLVRRRWNSFEEHLIDSPFSGPSRWKDQATGAKCGRASGSDVGTFTTKLFQLPECPETRFYIVFQ